MIKIECPLCKSNKNNKLLEIGNRIFPINISICNNCGFVFQNPRFTLPDWNDYYLKHYDKYHRPKLPIELSNNDDQSLLITFDRIEPFIKNESDIHSALEIGAGNGEIISYLANKISFKDVYAIEPSKDCQEELKKKGINVIAPSIDTIVSDSKIKMNLIVMRHVLEHIYNPVEALKIITNLMDDKSLFYIAVPNLFGFAEILNCFQFPHISYFNGYTFSMTANLAGLKVVEIKESGDELYGIFQKIKDRPHIPNDYNSSHNYDQTISYLNINMSKTSYLKKFLKRKLTNLLPTFILHKLLLKKSSLIRTSGEF